MTDMRTKLIEALEAAHRAEQAREMPEAELEAAVCIGLDLPLGTPFTDAQLAIIAAYRPGADNGS